MADLPADLLYTKDHEWVRVSDDRTTATVGITAFAQSELGDIVYVTVRDVGTTLAAEESFGSVEAVKTVSELYMPVSGTVAEINAALDGAPENVNTDPYGEGWMAKITLSDATELEDLLTAEAYAAQIGA